MTDKELEYVRNITEKYEYGGDPRLKQHVEHVARLSKRLATQFVGLGYVSLSPDYLLVAEAIALPHDIGRNAQLGQGRHNILSFQTLTKEFANGPLNLRDAVTIRYSALFHTGDEWRDTRITEAPELERLVRTWGGLLRVEDGLDFRALRSVNDVVFEVKNYTLICKVACHAEAGEMERAQRKTDLLKNFGLEVVVV
jgi:hypothetical protein